MKLYLWLILLAAINFFCVGGLLPFLFSAASSEAVAAGFLLLVLLPVADYWVIRKIIKTFKQLNKIKEPKNEIA